MFDPILDLKRYVATYEIRRLDQLSKSEQERAGRSRSERAAHAPYLVQTSRGRLVTLDLKNLENAVEILLQTRMPKLDAELPSIISPSEYYRAQLGATVSGSDRADLAALEAPVLQIASRIGMLNEAHDREAGVPDGHMFHESLEYWSTLARTIKVIFYAPAVRKKLRTENYILPSLGRLGISLSFDSGGASMRLIPDDLASALTYCAARMIARGSTVKTCDYCKGPFTLGGTNRGHGNRRADARFCSAECRYKYHNEGRRKAKLAKPIKGKKRGGHVS